MLLQCANPTKTNISLIKFHYYLGLHTSKSSGKLVGRRKCNYTWVLFAKLGDFFIYNKIGIFSEVELLCVHSESLSASLMNTIYMVEFFL